MTAKKVDIENVVLEQDQKNVLIHQEEKKNTQEDLHQIDQTVQIVTK